MRKSITVRKCEYCEKRFEPITTWQKYCERKCRDAVWRENNPRVKLPGKR